MRHFSFASDSEEFQRKTREYRAAGVAVEKLIKKVIGLYTDASQQQDQLEILDNKTKFWARYNTHLLNFKADEAKEQISDLLRGAGFDVSCYGGVGNNVYYDVTYEDADLVEATKKVKLLLATDLERPLKRNAELAKHCDSFPTDTKLARAELVVTFPESGPRIKHTFISRGLADLYVMPNLISLVAKPKDQRVGDDANDFRYEVTTKQLGMLLKILKVSEAVIENVEKSAGDWEEFLMAPIAALKGFGTPEAAAAAKQLGNLIPHLGDESVRMEVKLLRALKGAGVTERTIRALAENNGIDINQIIPGKHVSTIGPRGAASRAAAA